MPEDPATAAQRLREAARRDQYRRDALPLTEPERTAGRQHARDALELLRSRSPLEPPPTDLEPF